VLKPKEQYVHLCTPHHVWAIRQVSTSNSVHILHHIANTIPSTNLNTTTTSAPTLLSAFAQPNSTLELLPVTWDLATIKASIAEQIPYYPYPSQSPPPPSISEYELISGLPYPHSAVQRARRASFLVLHEPACYRAPPELLLASWTALFQHATANGRDLATANTSEIAHFKNELTIEGGTVVASNPKKSLGTKDGERHSDESLIASAIDALLAEFIEDPTSQAGDNPDRNDTELLRVMHGLQGRLKDRETTLSLGALLVQCAPGRRLHTVQLVTQWQNSIPDKWHRHCDVAALNGLGCTLDEDHVVFASAYTGRAAGAAAGAGAPKSAVAPAATINAAGKRNWHEMFAAQRKR
jgi:hypothetical protein